MPRPTTEQFVDRFAVGLTLDHLWSETMGLPVDDKEKVLSSLVTILKSTVTPYAVIGGVAGAALHRRAAYHSRSRYSPSVSR
jgi:hypothetical protein